jgi:hypothetical protein
MLFNVINEKGLADFNFVPFSQIHAERPLATVLAVAVRITGKHLLTLEAGISENQTDQMRASHLQLVIPAPLHATYKARQRAELMSVAQLALATEWQSNTNTTHV